VRAKAHALKARKDDLYETPPEAVRALLKAENLPHNIWEPACGPGSIVSVLRDAGHNVFATDLVDYGCPASLSGVDFLMERDAGDNHAIVTNPPFKLATEFVRHALELCPRVYMLLRLAFLESSSRCDILDDGRLARVHIFRNRLPMMHRHGWSGPKSTSTTAFAWFYWHRQHRGPALMNRISWHKMPPLNTDKKIPIAEYPEQRIP
jgi:hypothetical protein